MALIRTANSKRPCPSSEGKENDSGEQTNDDVNKRSKLTHGDPQDIRREIIETFRQQHLEAPLQLLGKK